MSRTAGVPFHYSSRFVLTMGFNRRSTPGARPVSFGLSHDETDATVNPRCPARQPEWQLHPRRMDQGGARGAKMAAVAGPELCKNGDRPMSKNLRAPATSVVSGNVPA